MRIIRFIVVLCFLLCMGASAGAETADAVGAKTICENRNECFRIAMFGDSITAPRGQLKVASTQLQDAMNSSGLNVEVLNAGVGGNTTSDALKRLYRDVIAEKPDLVFIMLGTNDAYIDVEKGKKLPRVPLDKYIENMKTIIGDLKKNKITPVLMTPPPMVMSEYRSLKSNLPPYSEKGFNFMLDTYTEALRKLADSEKVDLLDNYRIFQEKFKTISEMAAVMPDGIHPAQQGQDLISAGVIDIAGKKIREYGIEQKK